MVRDLLQLNTFHKRLIVGLIVAFCLLAIGYGALVRQTVSHVVSRKVIEQAIIETAARVSVLEGEYMRASDALTLSRAKELGFVETNVALFVSRRADTLTLRHDGNE